MKKFINSIYAVIILMTCILFYNLILFLSIKKEVLSLSTFWINYSCVMLGFGLIGSIIVVSRKNTLHVDLFVPVVMPFALIMIVLGSVLFAFVQRLSNLGLIIMNLVILFFIVIGYIVALMYQNSLKNIKEKEIVVRDYESMKFNFEDLRTKTSNASVVKELTNIITMIDKIKESNTDDVKNLDKRIFELGYFINNDMKKETMNDFYMHTETLLKLLNERMN